ncbi:hypothetical protein Anas_04481 [Armadillidium nasatum]|uniref:Uncharacterized protein n=1 Tax=Armadillidium nasatum TaxID=96803 RepID=A0A5N5TIG5_9CRUS|nr:hypothetical protein Anas_04481 [Armadillidium nasatum]
MSVRSRREHKPTTKYLNYYSEVYIAPNIVNKEQSNTPEVGIKCNAPSPVNSNPISSLIKRPKKICGRRKLTTDEVEFLCEDIYISFLTDKVIVPCSVDEERASPESLRKKSSSGEETSPEIRRSGRKHKPNLKLKEYIQPSNCNVDSLRGSPSPTTPKNRNRKNSDRGDSASSDSSSSTSPKKNMNYSKGETSLPTVEPYFDGFDDHEKPNMRKFSIGLVDCFEGLTKELAKTYPVTSDKINTPLNNKSNGSLEQNDERPENLKNNFPSTRRGIKRPFNDTLNRNFSNQKRFKPSTVRNLTKTRKSTRVTTVVETVDLRNNKRRKMMIKNQKLKVTKQYPIKESLNTTTTSNSLDSDTSSSSGTSSNQNINVPKSSKSSLAQKYFKKQEVDNQGKDIKETLKKFLIMGTKVANAISETLKHNEEALLSKSSAFERKCLSLVHALAQQGSDFEEDDMEKVLKLLDEEQEERRAYRHTFLESLRVSHLTNMALYSQMLRLLKTL